MGGCAIHEHCLARYIVDLMGAAVFILSGDGEIRLANRLARDLVDARRGLAVSRGALVADRAEETQRIRGALQHLRAPPHETVLTLARHACRQPLNLRLVRLNATDHSCAVLVGDPTAEGRVDHAELRGWFGLTRREAEVAAALGSGLTVGEAAETLGITRGTATTHQKHIYSKLGINSQVQLVHLLSRLPRSPLNRMTPVEGNGLRAG